MDAGSEESTNIVRFLKTNSGKKGQGMPVVRNPQFYFREGFCWIDVNSTYLKARLKGVGVFDVLSMSLFTQTQIADSYFVAIINSELISLYVDNFINNTSHFQINDARQLPIVIPSDEALSKLVGIVNDACSVKVSIQGSSENVKLNLLQRSVDEYIRDLYQID